jgi:CAAX protease family protein
MDAARLFLLPDGRLRAGWRLLLFLVFLVMAIIVFEAAGVALIRHSVSPAAVLAASTVAFLCAVSAATWLMMSLIEHRPFSAVGLSIGGQSLAELAVGIMSGAGLVGCVIGIEWAAGAIRFQPSSGGGIAALVLLASGGGIFALSATVEELLFRGYAFQRLIEGTNDYAAVALASIVFGGLHWRNPHSTKLALANTVLAGVLLSFAYLKTRALWLPIGFHFSWNWTLSLAGLPVSGMNLNRMPWTAVPVPSHTWLHGGDYGPEGGVVATAALTVGIALLIRMRGTTSLLEDGDASPSTSGDKASVP